MEITFPAIAPNNINFQAQTLQYPASGSNTNLLVKDYTLEFDMQIQGGNPDFNMEISIEGPDGTTLVAMSADGRYRRPAFRPQGRDTYTFRWPGAILFQGMVVHPLIRPPAHSGLRLARSLSRPL